MSDYLSQLISRSFRHADAIRPRPPGLFEPTSPTDGFTFQYAPTWNASDELYFHTDGVARQPTPILPIARPTNAGVPPLTDELSDPETPETLHPKTGDPVVKSVVSPLTWDEMENRLPPSATDFKDPTVPGDPVRNTPSAPSSDDWIPPLFESTESPEKAIRVRQVEVREHQGDTRKASLPSSETDNIAGNSERMPSLKNTDIERGFKDRRDMKSIVVKPHVSTHVENVEAVPFKSARITDEPPSVNVTIGRVEVRAIMKEAQPARRSRVARPGPSLSLDEYLKQRSRGQR